MVEECIKEFNKKNFFEVIRKISRSYKEGIYSSPEQYASFVYKKLHHYLAKYDKKPVKSFLVEESYIDKDFLIDYSIYYARSFALLPKHCIRIHFFSTDSKRLSEIFTELFKPQNPQKELIEEIKNNYVGFIVLKPLKLGETFGIVGRTLFSTYSEFDKKNNKRIFVKYKNKLNLAGLDLEVESLPFQEQDKAVAACATVALWTELIALKHVFKDGFLLSPGEITNRTFATVPFTTGRKFPNEGLSIYQLVSFFRDLGYEVMVYDIQNGLDKAFLKQLIYAYVKFNLPLIVTIEGGIIKRKKKFPKVYHAAVITGIKIKNNYLEYDLISDSIETLFIHDDQIGPYSKVDFKKGDILDWENEWLDIIKKRHEERNVYLTPRQIIIPLYSKIRLKMLKIYEKMLEFKSYLKATEKSNRFSFELYLTTVQELKNEVLYSTAEEKEVFLLKNFPKYLWVIKIYRNKNLHSLFAFDATNHILEPPVVAIKFS